MAKNTAKDPDSEPLGSLKDVANDVATRVLNDVLDEEDRLPQLLADIETEGPDYASGFYDCLEWIANSLLPATVGMDIVKNKDEQSGMKKLGVLLEACLCGTQFPLERLIPETEGEESPAEAPQDPEPDEPLPEDEFRMKTDRHAIRINGQNLVMRVFHTKSVAVILVPGAITGMAKTKKDGSTLAGWIVEISSTYAKSGRRPIFIQAPTYPTKNEQT